MSPTIPVQPCDRCHQHTPAGLLVTEKKSFYRGPVRLCINCRHGISRRTEWLLLLAFLLPFPAALIYALAMPSSTLGFCLAIACALSLFCLTVVPWHEGAHALAAAIFRHRVPYISIGRGTPLAVVRFRSTRIMFCGWGNGGLCAHLAYPRRAYVLADVLIIAAGPASNLLGAVLFPTLFFFVGRVFVSGPTLISPVVFIPFIFIFAGGHIVYFFLSAWPIYTRDRRPRNDAAMILDAIRRHRKDPTERARLEARGAITLAIADNDLLWARRIVDAGRAADPADADLLLQDAILLAYESQWHALHTLLEPVLPSLAAKLRPTAAELLHLAALHLEPKAIPALPPPLTLETGTGAHGSAVCLALYLLRAARFEEACKNLIAADYRAPSFQFLAFTHQILAELHKLIDSPVQAERHRRFERQLGPSLAVPPLLAVEACELSVE